MKISIVILLFTSIALFQNTSGSKASSRVIIESQLPPAASTHLKQMTGLHPRKITRNETPDKGVYYAVEMTNKDGREFYILKFAANGSLVKDSVQNPNK